VGRALPKVAGPALVTYARNPGDGGGETGMLDRIILAIAVGDDAAL
jgi:hypothetical protein